MKWVKTAIGAVIAIISIGIIAKSVYNMTQETEIIPKEVEFTVNVNETTYTPNVFENIMLYSDIDGEGHVNNISVVKFNNNVVTNDISIILEYDAFYIYSISQDGADVFDDDGLYHIEDGIFQDGDIITIVFEVTTPPTLSGVIATLLTLSILVFASAILFSFYNIRKEGDF